MRGRNRGGGAEPSEEEALSKANSPRRTNYLRPTALAFTLIEVLVCVAIIAILSGLLFAVLSPAKASAHKATCTSNLRQIGLAVSLYEQDHDDQMPYFAFNGWVDPNRNTHGKDLLAPYGTTDDLYLCADRPSDMFSRSKGAAYVLRFSQIAQPADHLKVLNWRVVPDAETVIAYDPNHMEHNDGHPKGIYLALRHSGSVERIQSSAVVEHDEDWLEIGGGYVWPTWLQFPREAFPPRVLGPEEVRPPQ